MFSVSHFVLLLRGPSSPSQPTPSSRAAPGSGCLSPPHSFGPLLTVLPPASRMGTLCSARIPLLPIGRARLAAAPGRTLACRRYSPGRTVPLPGRTAHPARHALPATLLQPPRPRGAPGRLSGGAAGSGAGAGTERGRRGRTAGGNGGRGRGGGALPAPRRPRADGGLAGSQSAGSNSDDITPLPAPEAGGGFGAGGASKEGEDEDEDEAEEEDGDGPGAAPQDQARVRGKSTGKKKK